MGFSPPLLIQAPGIKGGPHTVPLLSLFIRLPPLGDFSETAFPTVTRHFVWTSEFLSYWATLAFLFPPSPPPPHHSPSPEGICFVVQGPTKRIWLNHSPLLTLKMSCWTFMVGGWRSGSTSRFPVEKKVMPHVRIGTHPTCHRSYLRQLSLILQP